MFLNYPNVASRLRNEKQDKRDVCIAKKRIDNIIFRLVMRGLPRKQPMFAASRVSRVRLQGLHNHCHQCFFT